MLVITMDCDSVHAIAKLATKPPIGLLVEVAEHRNEYSRDNPKGRPNTV
ncbi:hypothetical protein [Pseudomonas sp. 10S4]|nr:MULTISPECIES: hypothetical protein [unclassified Pseudomonas]MEB0224368.1 hypothetical protein [Pseudomonas sp. 5S1]MEB0293198.1 hypothetical protein [Pseudomonas sp. 10S4]WPX17898.1 hypothetical protein RHM58_29555 [Pseudomonas sp. 10S4]